VVELTDTSFVIVQLAPNEPVWITVVSPGMGVTKVATGAAVAAAAGEIPPKPATRMRPATEARVGRRR
jgi:hypothetical protein